MGIDNYLGISKWKKRKQKTFKTAEDLIPLKGHLSIIFLLQSEVKDGLNCYHDCFPEANQVVDQIYPCRMLAARMAFGSGEGL